MSERDVTPGKFARKVTPRAVLVVVAVVIVLAFGFSSFFMVDQQEEAVILRFGKFLRLSPPGLHFKMPFGIDQNLNVPTARSLKEEFGFRTERAGANTVYSSRDYTSESEMLTGDLLIVNVEWIIQYQIIDPRAYLFNVEDAERTIRDISQSAINQLVGDRAIDAVLTQERSTIEFEGRDLMNKLYDQLGIGVRVSTVKLQDVVPPAGPVQQAYEDVNKSIQDRDRSINEGIEAYNQAIPKAQGTARKLIQEAEGYAQRRVNQAQGDVARFNAVLKEYRASPQVTRARLYYEMWESVFSDSAANTDLIDRNLKNFLPLKNMDTGTAAAPAQQGGAMKKVVVTLVIVGVLLIIVLVLGPFYTVTEGQQAVVTRFGKIVAVQTTAGLKLKAPFTDTVVTYPKKLITWDGAPQIVPTAEKKFVFVDTTARFKIMDPQKFYETLGTITQAHSRLDDLIDGEVRTIISSNNFSEAVRNSNDILSYVKTASTAASDIGAQSPQSAALDLDKIAKGRQMLSAAALANVQSIVPQFGIQVVNLLVRQIKYSDDLTKSVHDRMITERNKEAERYRSQGLGEKDFWLGKMQRELEFIQSDAYKQSETIKGQADATAARIYAQSYNQDPEFYQFWKSLDSYQKLLPKFKKVLTTDAEYFRYLYQASGR